MTKKNYNSIDLFKFICAILIIIIHTAPFSSYSSLLTFGFRNIICVIAVPFFFIASGFIFFKKMDNIDDPLEKKQAIKRQLNRLIIMYCLWSLIYLGFVIYKWVNAGFQWSFVLEYVKDFFLEGSYQTIWFLPALIVATLLVYLLHKKFSYKTIFLISLPIYLFTLLGSSYYGLAIKVPFIKSIYDAYYTVFDTIKNGVCFGLIFVSMGGWIGSQKESKLNFKMNLLLVIVLFVIFAAEEFLVAKFDWNTKGVDTTIFLVPLSYFIFKCVKDIKLPDSKVWVQLRKLSMLMFLSQRIPLSIIELFMADTIFYTNSLLFFVTVLLSTLGISYLLIYLSKKVKFLKYLC